MTLISTYNPDSQVSCPTCDKLVSCRNIGGVTFGLKPYLDFKHDECETLWRYYIRTGETVTPIPKLPCIYCGGLHDGPCNKRPQSPAERYREERDRYRKALEEIRNMEHQIYEIAQRALDDE